MTTGNGDSKNKKMMQALFSPAVALMSRLDITRKFALLGLMSLVAVAVVVYSLYASLDNVIESSQRELKGLELIKPFPQVVQLLQEHRGLSAGLLGGDAAMQDARTGVSREADQALNRILAKPLTGVTTTRELQPIRGEWERLNREGGSWTAGENFAAHTRLIARVQALETAIADEYVLILDPDLASYYLIDTIVNSLPYALEQLGKLRAYSTGILAERRITERQRMEMTALIAGLDEALRALRNNLDKAGRYNPALGERISSAFGDIDGSARQITDLVKANILAGHLDIQPGEFFRMSTTAIDSGYRQLHDALLPTAENLVRARIARAERTLRVSVGIASLFFLVVAYFSIGIIRTIIVNVRSLADSARAFAGGKLDTRVGIDTHDELGQVGESFNEMAEGFGALLKASRESEAQLRDLSEHLEERVRQRTAELEKVQHETEVLLRRNQALMMTSMDGIHVLDMQGNILAANDAFCRMLGYTQRELSGLNVTDWDAQWSAEELQERFRELIGKSAMLETLWRCKDGTLVDVEISASGVRLEGQNFIFASSRDVTSRKQVEAALRRHKVVVDTAIDGFWMTDMNGYLLEANEAYARMSGYSIEELVGMHISQLEVLEQPADVRAHIARIMTQGHDRFETRHRRKDGQEIDIEISVTHMAESQQLFVFCRDITERKRAEEEIRNLAFYDPLTRLPNRRLFIDRFHAALSVSVRRNSYGAVLFIDLDRFKELNDTLGHDYGDLLLIEVANRIRACVREMDTVARLGGDEFVVLIEEVADDRDEAARKVGLVAEKIREALARPYRLKECEHLSSPSIGVSLYRGNGETVDALLRQADMAMYRAKKAGRNAVCFFDAGPQQAAQS